MSRIREFLSEYKSYVFICIVLLILAAIPAGIKTAGKISESMQEKKEAENVEREASDIQKYIQEHFPSDAEVKIDIIQLSSEPGYVDEHYNEMIAEGISKVYFLSSDDKEVIVGFRDDHTYIDSVLYEKTMIEGVKNIETLSKTFTDEEALVAKKLEEEKGFTGTICRNEYLPKSSDSNEDFYGTQLVVDNLDKIDYCYDAWGYIADGSYVSYQIIVLDGEILIDEF